MPFSANQSTDQSRRNQEKKSEVDKGEEAAALWSRGEFLTPIPNAAAAALQEQLPQQPKAIPDALQQQLPQQQTPSMMLRQLLLQQLNPPLLLQQENPQGPQLTPNLHTFQKQQQQKISRQPFQMQPLRRQQQQRQLQQNELEMLLLLQNQQLIRGLSQNSFQFQPRQVHQSEIAYPISTKNQQLSSLCIRDCPRISSAGISFPRVDIEASLSPSQPPGISMPDFLLAALVAENNGAPPISATNTITPRLSDAAFLLQNRQQEQLASLFTDHLSSGTSFLSHHDSSFLAGSNWSPMANGSSTSSHQRQQCFLSQASSVQHTHYLLDLAAQLQQQQAAWRQSQESCRDGAAAGGAGVAAAAAAAVVVVGAQNTIVKAPEKPKRPLSAYNIFFKDERVKMLEELQTQEQESNDADDDADVDPSQQPRRKLKKKNKSRRPKRGKTISFEEMARHIGKKWHLVDQETKNWRIKKGSYMIWKRVPF